MKPIGSIGLGLSLRLGLGPIVNSVCLSLRPRALLFDPDFDTGADSTPAPTGPVTDEALRETVFAVEAIRLLRIDASDVLYKISYI